MSQSAPSFDQGLYPKSHIGSMLLRRGPSFAGLALPYGIGSALQRFLLSPTTVRHGLFAVPSDLFLRSLRAAGDGATAAPEEALTLSLMANTWTVWRRQALCSTDIYWQWVAIKGNEQLNAALALRKGLIVVFVHQHNVAGLVRQLLAVHGYPMVPVVAGNRPDDYAAPKVNQRSKNAWDALTLLRHGQPILIAGEGRGAADPLVVPFYGRSLPMPRGFAALAQLSQAPVIAAFSTMAGDGHMTLELVRLPTSTSIRDVDALIYQYLDLVVQRWSGLLPTMNWMRLAYLASLSALA